MKIQTPTEFLTFSDGLCDIYSVSGNKLDGKLMTLCYGNRTVGVKRYYAARAAKAEINRLIQVPMRKDITAANAAVISGVRYKIDQVQYLNNTNPPTTVLTLQQNGTIT
jgi:hypothetical protein